MQNIKSCNRGALGDRVRITKKKVHPKFFQNPFLGFPWSVWTGKELFTVHGGLQQIKGSYASSFVATKSRKIEN